MEYENLWVMGEKLYHGKKYNVAIPYFEQAIEVATVIEDKNSCMNYIACCYIELENYEKAYKILKVLTKTECWERPWFNLGRIHLKQGDNKRAFECFNKALEIAPEECDCYFYMGVYHEKNNEYEKAILFYKESIKFARDDYDVSVACQNIGICLKRLKRYEEAMLYCDKAYKFDNSCLDALYNKALLLIIMKKYNDAIKLLEEVYDKGLNDDRVKKDIEYCAYKMSVTQGDGSVV